MNSRNIFEPFQPSSDEDSLKEQFWALHEAVFRFTEWPKYNLFKTPIPYCPNVVIGDLLPDRRHIYLPKDRKIDPKAYGKRFEDVYNHLKEAIENGDLPFNNFRVKDNVYFLTSYNVITWALINGYILPITLQEALNIYPQDSSVLQLHAKTRTALPMKVREMIVAQLLLAIDSTLARNRTVLCKKVLGYVDPKRNDLTSVRESIEKILGFPGRKGRIKQSTNGQSEVQFDSYTPYPIKEILNKNSEGSLCCNYELFFEAIKQGIRFKKCSFTKEKVLRMDLESFHKELLEDKVLNVYFQDSEFVMGPVKKWIADAWYELNSTLGIYDERERSLLSNYNKIKTTSPATIGLTISQALALTERKTLN